MEIDEVSEATQHEPKPRTGWVVAVGAATGGLASFRRLLEALGHASTLAFVFVQHRDAAHEDEWVEQLAPHTPMRVLQAVDGDVLEPATVYVVGPAAVARMHRGALVLESSPPVERGEENVIDELFRSVAQEQGSRSVAILLSGVGSDGLAGMRELRALGGLTIAQDPETANQPESLHCAIRMGAAELVLSVEDIPAALQRFIELPSEVRTSIVRDASDDRPSAPDIVLSSEEHERLAEVLGARSDFDVKQYKRGTVERRVLRRMGLCGFETLGEYLDDLRLHENERQTLARDLLIHVTRFFRDGEAFDAFKTVVARPLVQEAGPGETLRVWVPGVSTGEEAYSIAMVLLETMEEERVALNLQVFATDPDEDALSVGRQGIYPAAIAEQVRPDRLERFFTLEPGHGYRVQPHVRELVSFAVHDLCKNPPFSRMHLVSCRNVLIYLRRHAQSHVLRVLHFALRPNGYLWLGTHESLSNEERVLFTPASKRWRLYRRASVTPPLPRSRWAWEPRPPPSDTGCNGERLTSDQRIAELARRAVIRSRVPPTVVVGDDDRIVFMHGDLGDYLRFPEGELRHDLSSFLRPDLATRTRAAVHRCRRSLETVTALSRPEGFLGPQTCITASPAPEVSELAVIVTFEEEEPSKEVELVRPIDQAPHDAIIDQLERELQATREDLRNTVEQLESSNEELRAANEETMSMNEELQSANEELEATTEELRSLNEEITSVNVQLRDKIDELEQTHDDLTNFFGSTKLATIFLDTHLRIKRITPTAEQLLALGEDDKRRYVGDIARELLGFDLVEEARAVLRNLAPARREIEAQNRWFVRQVLPYQTGSRRVEGVVVTLTDITELREATRRLERREAQQVVLARLGMQALEEPDLENFMNQAVREVRRVLDVDYCKILELAPDEQSLLLRAGVGWKPGLVGVMSVTAGIESQAGFTLQSREAVVVDDLNTEKRFSGPSLLLEHEVKSGLSCVIGDVSQPYGVLGAHTRAQHTFTVDDVDFLEGVATLVASAIDRQRLRLRMSIEAAVAKVLAHSKSLDEAAVGIHRALVRMLGIAVGELWWPSTDGRKLVRRVLTVTQEQQRSTIAAARPESFFPGEGFIGRVWMQGRAETVALRNPAVSFVGLQAARQLGLVSGLAFPIQSGGEILGVLAVFSSTRFIKDMQFMRSLEWIGRATGELVRRLDAENALREREERIRDVFENVGVSLWELDFSHIREALDDLRGQGTTDVGEHIRNDPRFVEHVSRQLEVLQVNTETLRLFGAASAAELSAALEQVFVMESREALTEAIIAFDAGARTFACETRLGTLGGGRIDAAVTLRMPSSAQHSSRVLVSIMDTTALGRARAELDESRRWFKSLTEATPDIVTVYDVLEDRMVYANRETADVLGYTPDELQTMGSIIERLAHPDDFQAVQAFFASLGSGRNARNTDREGRFPEHVYRVKHRSGQYRWFHVRAVPFRLSESGRVRQALLVARDITELKCAEGELREANRQKDEYLAMLGHELRNPLAAVRGATELIKLRGGEDSGLRRIHGVLERQTSHMAKLLDGLLDVSRIVRGKIELDTHRVDWVGVLKDVVADREDEIKRRGLQLRLDLPDDPLWVEGDRVRLTQIMDNLLSNAINYTNPPGTIVLAARHVERGAIVEVRDSGVGIEPELLPHIFETFRQAGQSLDRAKGGLGLGLALVKGLVELHGGRVEAHSDGPGKGARFTVRLPLADAVPETRSQLVGKPRSRRILIIEDNEDAAHLLARVLELGGHEVSLASTGQEGLDAAQRLRPEVVLCDLGLPDGMSGFDVARTLRRDTDLRDVFLIAVTGYGRPEDRRRSAEAGFDAHLTKPVDLQTLTEVLEHRTESVIVRST